MSAKSEARAKSEYYATTGIIAKLKKHQIPVVNFLKSNDISILIGEAGTAKDFCQMYRALDGLIEDEFSKVVLIKPCLEIGKSMGFLPGDEDDKTAPYAKSFHENMNMILDKNLQQKYKNKIEFEPTNFLRGNTFRYSCVILSEAQNCTLHELMTVVTRMSHTSKLFINGDLLQSDIKNSGLKDFISIMRNMDGLGVMELGDEHQMRHPMIVEMNRRYRKFLSKNLVNNN